VRGLIGMMRMPIMRMRRMIRMMARMSLRMVS
jgi:hypothetical protein